MPSKMDLRARQKSHHKAHHKRLLSRMKRKYRRVAAAALAGAAIMSSSLVPGVGPVAHAAANPANDTAAAPPATEQQQQTVEQQAKSPEANAPQDYEKVVEVKATAYAPGAADNDQWGDKTHLGTQVRPGVIAVDPKIIPLGSRVFIQYPDGHGEYAVAEDTGGAIKGNRIDVAKWSRDQAKDFGIKNAKVFVISSPRQT
ncbi:MAG TPA: 3D domain-containing protein [Negativicutes bacterium]|nr:3D domain-containing protein [Negativicutes bacterium]